MGVSHNGMLNQKDVLFGLKKFRKNIFNIIFKTNDVIKRISIEYLFICKNLPIFILY